MGGHPSALSQPIKELREVRRFIGMVGVTLVKQGVHGKDTFSAPKPSDTIHAKCPFCLNYFTFKIISIMYMEVMS